MYARLIVLGLCLFPSLGSAETALRAPAKAGVQRLAEPGLRLAGFSGDKPVVALTFDACMGKADERIVATLVKERIPATIFVTARWMRRNPQTVTVFRQNSDLFEIEDHGAEHVPAVDFPTRIYGLAAAGSPEAVAREVEGGAQAIVAQGFAQPRWFRGATAKYSVGSMRQIATLGYEIAGYSVNGDGGSLLGAAATKRNYLSARSGDVIISHINQPTHAAGAGVVAGILELKKRGYRFIRLEDGRELEQKAPGH